MSQTKINVGMIDGSGTPGSGNFLRGDGSWQAAGGGAWTLIGSATASSSASIGVTGLDRTAYDQYGIGISGVQPVSDGQSPRIQIGGSGGLENGSGNWLWHTQQSVHNATVYGTARSTASYSTGILSSWEISSETFGTGNQTGEMYFAMLYLNINTERPMYFGTYTNTNGSGVAYGGTTFGAMLVDVDITQIQLHMTSGNILAGRLTVWGIKYS